MGINFWGVVTGTKEFLPHLIESGDGHLVNISSLFGLISTPGQSTYNSSKYAVRGFTEALREEMLIAGHPVGVTCVHPGGIKTGISRNGRKTAGQDAEALDRLFEKKLARMEPERAARDHRGRDPQGQGPAAGRHRRPPDPPRVQAARVALPGRRRALHASVWFRPRSRSAAVRMGPCSPGPLSRSR